MKFILVSCLAMIISSVWFNQAWAHGCPSDMVEVGPLCVDTYEASVWSDRAGTGTQYGESMDDYPCSDNGNDCDMIFAVSKEGAVPSSRITWFQAQQACANVGKRLLTNAEWQMAAAGTPDPGDVATRAGCNTNSGARTPAGERILCESNWGTVDMVGNLWEMVADWIQDSSDIDNGSISTDLYDNDAIFGVDEAGPAATRFPAALQRGGTFTDGSRAGVFALSATSAPSQFTSVDSFRCGWSN